MTKKTATTFNSEQVAKAAERTHALLQTALGTKGTPPYEEVRASIQLCLDSAAKYPDEDYFHGTGLVVRVDRGASPWPTFEVLVSATANLYLRDTR